jgi:coenzyme F420 hydrogenase subunit beta
VVIDLKKSVSGNVYQRLREEVVDRGLCTHCGTCAGLSDGSVIMTRERRGPIPVYRRNGASSLTELAYQVCPGFGVNYPDMFRWLFDCLPDNWLIGVYRKIFLGHSSIPMIRRNGSSGGVITQTLLYLLEHDFIDGAVVLQHGQPEAWLSTPIIAQSAAQIEAAAQSVYVPTPMNTILAEIESFDGRLAYVGLPDQVAAIRQLQRSGHAGAKKIEYIIGPYVGTILYLEAIKSYLRSNGGKTVDDVAQLRYREGEWPGFLEIRLKSGETLREKKFYYNYLIPFYLTASTLLSVDFTNELTDISVGDAWQPQLEEKGEGFAVVLARTDRGLRLLNDMMDNELLALEEISLDSALAMHGHMLDFKKRGSFIRMGWRRRLGLAVPTYGYAPERISFFRFLVEFIISGILFIGHSRLARYLVERIPLRLIGPLFNIIRKTWKRISKPTKRSGLRTMTFRIAPPSQTKP